MRKVPKMPYPMGKDLVPWFANAAGGLSMGGHGPKGSPFVFVDDHSQFATLRQLNPGIYGDYNLDWTQGGLAGNGHSYETLGVIGGSSGTRSVAKNYLLASAARTGQ